DSFDDVQKNRRSSEFPPNRSAGSPSLFRTSSRLEFSGSSRLSASSVDSKERPTDVSESCVPASFAVTVTVMSPACLLASSCGSGWVKYGDRCVGDGDGNPLIDVDGVVSGGGFPWHAVTATSRTIRMSPAQARLRRAARVIVNSYHVRPG